MSVRSALALSLVLAAMSWACVPREPAGEEQEPGAADRLDEPAAAEATADIDPPVQPADAGAAPAVREPERATPAAAPAQQRRIGRVAVTGSEPVTLATLQVAEGPAVQLVGPLESELRRLAGATVAVEGTPGTGRLPGEALEVLSYEVLAIDGQRPHVGTLRQREGVWELHGATTFRLSAVPEGLARRPGAEVWVIGRAEGDQLHVQSYGVIRP